MSNLKNWSSTPANNNQTPPLGWPEGMKASDVNNTARQDRSDIRKWYIDASWIDPGGSPTYVSATQFTIADDSEITDYSQYYSNGRRLRLTSNGSIVYVKVTSVTYSNPTTTVDFEVVDGTMGTSITVAEYSVIQDNKALPDGAPVDPATETTQGIIAIANTTEAITAENDTKSMTPLKSKQQIEQNPNIIAPRNFIDGYTFANNSVDSDHDIDFTGGVARDSTNVYIIDSDVDYTKQADADWAAGDAAGGMPASVQKEGTFTTVGTAVTGVASAFTTDFKVGDVLWSDSKSEGRRITVIGGDLSITIESAFTTDVSVADNVKKNGLAPNATYHTFALYVSDPSPTNGVFVTTDISSNLTNFQAVGDGYITVQVDGGTPQQLTDLDFTSATDMDDVASIIDAPLTGATVTNSSGVLTFTSDSTGTSSTVLLVNLVLTGTNLYGASYLDGASGTQTNGQAEKTDLYDYGFDTQTTAENLLVDANVVTAGLDKIKKLPTLPPTDASANILPFIQSGTGSKRSTIYEAKILDYSFTGTSLAEQDLPLSIPLGVRVWPLLSWFINAPDNGDGCAAQLVSPLNPNLNDVVFVSAEQAEGTIDGKMYTSISDEMLFTETARLRISQFSTRGGVCQSSGWTHGFVEYI